MKRILKLTIILIFSSVLIPFQKTDAQVEVTPYTGFMFGGNYHGYNNYIDIEDGQNYGIATDITIFPGGQVELMYNRMVSSASFRGYYDNDYGSFDLASEYFHIGALQEVMSGKVRPFGNISIGLAVFTPQNREFDTDVSFSFNFGGGVKVYLTDMVGIRLQGRLMMPVYFTGVGFGCGIGTGGASCGGAGLSSVLLQGDFSAGLIISLAGGGAE